MAAVGGGGPLSGASPGVLAELASAAALAADAARSLRPPPDVTALARAAVAETASAATVWARLALRLATPAAAAAVAGVRAAAPGVAPERPPSPGLVVPRTWRDVPESSPRGATRPRGCPRLIFVPRFFRWRGGPRGQGPLPC